jgi:TPR repeat protein
VAHTSEASPDSRVNVGGAIKTKMLNRWSTWTRLVAGVVIVACAGCTSTGGPASSASDRALNAKSTSSTSNPDQRLALVIGNSKYAESPLVNPVNDARAMTAALSGLGFTVTNLYDASLTEMNDASRQFGDKLRAGGVGLFFYAGHGMQIRGKNYLIPVGADIKREDEVQYKAFDANQLLDKMEIAHNPINIVILDACRNNPFSRSFRSSATGLAQMEAPVGTYVSFSTAPGRVASDGDGSNGLFTQHLLGSLKTPGLKVEDVFKQVRVHVMQDSGGQQIPWDSSSLTGDFYFLRPDPNTLPAKAPAQAAETPAKLPQQAQYKAAQTADSPAKVAQNNQSSSPPPAPPAQQAAPPPVQPATQPAQAVTRPAPPPAAVAPAPSAAASTTKAAEQPASESAKAARTAAKAAAPERMLLAKANTGVSAAPPSQSGSEDAYKRGMEAYKKSDMQGAYDLFAQSAEQGNPGAQYELAMFQKAGRNPVKQDVVQARRWFTRAAEQGNVSAQYELGQMLDQGTGGEKSCKDAEKWLRRAADKAHVEAMVQMGWMNLRGCSGEKNPAEAAKWLRQAAAKGSREAQFSLGVLYFNGEGVAKDPGEARKLLEAAAAKGHPSAKFYLDRLQ